MKNCRSRQGARNTTILHVRIFLPLGYDSTSAFLIPSIQTFLPFHPSSKVTAYTNQAVVYRMEEADMSGGHKVSE